MKKKLKIGETIQTEFALTDGTKKKVEGKVKDVVSEWGHTTYVVKEGKVEEFRTRKVL